MLADAVGSLLPKKTTCVAGSGHGGLPLAAVVATRLNKKFIAVREGAKKHGLSKLIDGYFPEKNESVIIIDDVLTTGSSLRDTRQILTQHKIKVAGAIIVVDRTKPKISIPYKAVFNIKDFS
jgi:orotate phosphoribosyltransferase